LPRVVTREWNNGRESNHDLYIANPTCKPRQKMTGGLVSSFVDGQSVSHLSICQSIRVALIADLHPGDYISFNLVKMTVITAVNTYSRRRR